MDKGEFIRYMDEEKAKIEKYLLENKFSGDNYGMIILKRGLKEYYHAMDVVEEYIIKGGDKLCQL